MAGISTIHPSILDQGINEAPIIVNSKPNFSKLLWPSVASEFVCSDFETHCESAWPTKTEKKSFVTNMQNVKEGYMSFWATKSSSGTIRNPCGSGSQFWAKKKSCFHIWGNLRRLNSSKKCLRHPKRKCILAEENLWGGRRHHFPPAMILRYCSALWAALARAASLLGANPWHTVIGCVDSSTRHWHKPLRLRSSETQSKRVFLFHFVQRDWTIKTVFFPPSLLLWNCL